MTNMQKIILALASTMSMGSIAADFSFDRPGAGIGTGITPVGHVAWEQGLPTANYNEIVIDGAKARTVTLNGEMVLRTGLNSSTELQLGWQGPGCTKTSYKGRSHDQSGSGDVIVGIKKAIDLDDDKLSMAVLAQAQLATGNEEFSAQDDIYSLGSALNFQYNDDVTTGMSMIYEVQDGDWAVTAVPNIGYKIAGKLSGFSELVYRKQESSPYEYSLGSGLIYAVNDRAQLDASIGVKLSGEEQRNYNAGLGFSFLF